jgi:tripartite-type tricarboxylate transporter receptor subunit TctC
MRSLAGAIPFSRLKPLIAARVGSSMKPVCVTFSVACSRLTSDSVSFASKSVSGSTSSRDFPSSIIERFAGSLHKALQVRDVKQRLASQGLDTAVSTPEELREIITADIAKWAKVVREAAIQPE